MADTLAPVQNLLASTSLNDYLAARPPATVVTVSDTDRLDTVLALLSSRAILSAPVFKAGTARCLGFVSVADVLRAVLAWAAVGTGASPAARAEGLQRAATRLARERVRDLGKANDGALLWRKAEGGMSLLDVVRLGFLRGGGAPPVHRVAIYDVLDEDDGGAWTGSAGGGGSGDAAAEPSTSTPSPALAGAPVRFVAVLSQTDVVAFLAKRAAADPASTLGPLAAARVGDLNVASAPVVSVPAGMPAAHAFAALLDRGGQVSAAAVVAQTQGDDGCAPGAVVADCSSRSLRGLSSDRVTALARPILDFLRAPAAPACSTDGAATAAAEWGVIGADAAPLPLAEVAPARVAPGASFGELLTLLAGGGARRHRAYVVDGDGRPQGIISLTDVLRLIARE